jgi:hypothetical protein
MNEEKYSKLCPQCGSTIYYKNSNSYHANRKKQNVCRECKCKGHSVKLKGKKLPPFTNEWKRNLATSHKKSDVWKASMNTPEYKEKHRQKMLRMIRENKTSVAFNPRACDVFDFLNNQLHWNGQHAKAGKEKVVDVFFLDYYEPFMNVAIEWDEKHHRKPSRHRGDWFKQKVVMDTLGCEFYRVNEVSKQVKKVDKLTTDRTPQLQEIINNYYEIKK